MTDSVKGYGKSFSSFGEIVQGRLANDEDFLITLPVDLWATCEIERVPIDAKSEVICEFEKSKRVAFEILNVINKSHGERLHISFTRNIPIGKGLSSSTADMLSVVRALQEIYGFIATEQLISRIFRKIEPHDALHYYMSVAYNHRSGELICKLNYIPQYVIVMLDFGGATNTEDYNVKLSFTEIEKNLYDKLYKRTVVAFMHQDDIEIAKCATESTRLHFDKHDKKLLVAIDKLIEVVDPLGVMVTHSGTCLGLLYNKKYSLSVDVQKLILGVIPGVAISQLSTLTLLQ
jgi:uncharacterized protein involved in propanediol utilization